MNDDETSFRTSEEEIRVVVTCAWDVDDHTFPYKSAAEAHARNVVRRWSRDRGEAVEATVTFSRREVTPWQAIGDTSIVTYTAQ